jgi:hypothetical protein
MIKKIIISLLFSILASTVNITYSNYDDFVNELESMNFDVKNISSQHYVSRYDLSKYTSAVTCDNCLIPNKNYLNKFNIYWRNDFKDIP